MNDFEEHSLDDLIPDDESDGVAENGTQADPEEIEIEIDPDPSADTEEKDEQADPVSERAEENPVSEEKRPPEQKTADNTPHGTNPPYGGSPYPGAQGGAPYMGTQGYPYGQPPRYYPPQGNMPPQYGYQQPPYYRYPEQNNPYPPQGSSYPYGAPANGYAYTREPAETEAPVKKKNGMKIFIILAAILFVGIIVGVVIGFGSGSSSPDNDSEAEEENTVLNVEEFSSAATPDSEITTSAEGAFSPKEIYELVKESSVGILVYDSSKALSSEGTGVIMTEDNDGKYTYIVTCAHVIADKNVTIMVQLFSGKEYAAQVIGFDAKTDIGVLRIEESGLAVAEFGDSNKLKVGDIVYAIGNPGGTEFANSFTNGMISAIDRPVSSSTTGYTMECIQHTAAINPGNSGGALVNEFGQIIGINSMKIIADEYEGMGFAVPSSVFIDIVNEIIANGYVSNRPKLGITYVSASTQQSYAMYVAIKGLPAGSIIVYSISEDSDLANSEVQKGDMITAVNGKDLDDAAVLSEIIEQSKVGDILTLSIVRINSDYSAEEFDVKVKLVEDRGDTMPEEETTTGSFYDDHFNDGDEYGGDFGSDYFEDFFNDFFGRYGTP